MSKLANPSVCVPRLGAAAVRERNYDWEWCARPRLRPLLACAREPTRRTYFEVKHKNINAPNAHTLAGLMGARGRRRCGWRSRRSRA